MACFLGYGFWYDKPLKWILKQFISIKLWSFGFLFGMFYLIAGAWVKDWGHYSTILAVSALVTGIMCGLNLRRVMPEKMPTPTPAEVEEKHKLPAGWLYPILGVGIGAFALMAAWGLFPNLGTQGSWLTFILLLWVALTFLTRAASVLNFHIWAPTGIAVWAGTNMMGWIGLAHNFMGITITLDMTIVYALTAALTFGAWVLLTLILMWLSQTNRIVNKILNSTGVLFINTLLCFVWSAWLVLFPWLL